MSLKKIAIVLLTLLLVLLVTFSGAKTVDKNAHDNITPEPQPAQSPIITPSSTETPQPMNSPEPTLQPEPQPTPVATSTPLPTSTPQVTPQPTSAPQPTSTPTQPPELLYAHTDMELSPWGLTDAL